MLCSKYFRQPKIVTIFGNHLKEERLKRKLTQENLTELIGDTQASLAFYENDEQVPLPNRLKQLSSLLNLSPSALLGHHASVPAIKKIHGVIRCSNHWINYSK
ncbi:helix-turn-helix transcriptional regulator [Halalkalibacter flavus]|uniref:helix-turn-helix transcriptional regulator n=1 Tax=Halalkalibacter flavus TaxID=3090668 RepID=UPI003D66F68F